MLFIAMEKPLAVFYQFFELKIKIKIRIKNQEYNQIKMNQAKTTIHDE